MPVTYTNTFTVTRDDVIKASLRVLGVLGEGEQPTTEDYLNCTLALNMMIKNWAVKGAALWAIDTTKIHMIKDIDTYPLGVDGGYLHTNGITIVNGGTGGTDGVYALTITDVTGTGATGTYTITGGVVTSIAITAPGTQYKAPVLTFPLGSISGVVVETLPVGLYMSRPLSIKDCFLRNQNNIDLTLIPISQQEYAKRGAKFSGGNPNQYYYNKQIETSYLSVFNVPVDNLYDIVINYQRQFYDMVTSTDGFDFPQSWFLAIKWNLAASVAPEYLGIDIQKLGYIEQKAAMTLQEVFDESVEDTSVYFMFKDK